MCSAGRTEATESQTEGCAWRVGEEAQCVTHIEQQPTGCLPHAEGTAETGRPCPALDLLVGPLQPSGLRAPAESVNSEGEGERLGRGEGGAALLCLLGTSGSIRSHHSASTPPP